MQYQIINSSFATHFGKSVGSEVTYKELQGFWGEYTNDRIKQYSNILIKVIEPPKAEIKTENKTEKKDK